MENGPYSGINVKYPYEYFADKEAVISAMDQYVIAIMANKLIRPLTPALVKMSAKDAVRELLFAFRDLLLLFPLPTLRQQNSACVLFIDIGKCTD